MHAAGEQTPSHLRPAPPRPINQDRPKSVMFDYFDRTLESPYMRSLLYQHQATKDGE